MISVCMATYNGEKYLSQQMNSILDQLGKSDELIIVDDLSGDRTIEIIKSFGDTRIKLIRNSNNSGVVKAFEKALDMASGDYIFLSDQDDVWLPDKVSAMMEKLDAGFDLVVSDAFILNKGIIQDQTFYSIRKSGPGFIKNAYKNTFIGCCMAFRAEYKKTILPIPERISMHDAWIGQLITIFGKVCFLDKPLIFYRRHDENVTSMSRGNLKSVARKRVVDLICLISRSIHVKRAGNQ
ncbi:alpha-L-Rha alpha-1,3-L-rhamnosyltransferase [Deinococcus ficus]|nr:alpha-L-Rha alpha-1,3-L-rhamnosyltransferase [Deinococcus ficus]